MVAATSQPPMPNQKPTAFEIPTIDLAGDSRQNVSKHLVEACQELGFFKVIDHGVSPAAISKLEDEMEAFFAKPAAEKLAARPTTPFGRGLSTPFGYGLKNIGRNGDMGELEYVLLRANPTAVSLQSAALSSDPLKFSCAVNDYVEASRNLACELLDLMAEGLCISDNSIFSRLIRDVENDSVLRINHYPPLSKIKADPPSKIHQVQNENNRIGFGEHFDPQILTILRSNDVGGFEIRLPDGLWVPVAPDPTAIYVLVGDAFQALTNGRFRSIKHRVMENREKKARLSMVYSAAPAMDVILSPLPEMVTETQPEVYRPFTWAEFKDTTYTLRLADTRLHLFKLP